MDVRLPYIERPPSTFGLGLGPVCGLSPVCGFGLPQLQVLETGSDFSSSWRISWGSSWGISWGSSCTASLLTWFRSVIFLWTGERDHTIRPFKYHSFNMEIRYATHCDRFPFCAPLPSDKVYSSPLFSSSLGRGPLHGVSDFPVWMKMCWEKSQVSYKRCSF